ncbi:MAG TPA: hypothetical protein VIU36_07055 [Gammaproteobacteria bacterium]|jgi:hypothetical protein
MIKLILIAITVIVILNFRDGLGFTSFEAPEIIQVSRQGSGIRKHEFQQLFDANRPLSSLAKKGRYTVVEGYLDSCSTCKRIEAGFPAFLQKRQDVFIQRVHFPEQGMQFSFSGTDRESLQRMADEYNQRIQSYNFCSTPHIEIYDQNRQLLVADTCTKKSATAYLERWMASE